MSGTRAVPAPAAKAVSVPALEAGSVVFLVAGARAVPAAVAVVAVPIGVGRLEVRARITTAIVLAGSDAVAVARVKREIGGVPFAGGVRIGGVVPLIPICFAAAVVTRDAAEGAVVPGFVAFAVALFVLSFTAHERLIAARFVIVAFHVLVITDAMLAVESAAIGAIAIRVLVTVLPWVERWSERPQSYRCRYCTTSAAFGLHNGRVALHLAGAPRHRLGHVIANALPLPRDLVHGLANTSAGLLELVGRAIANVVERLGQLVSEL